MSEYTFVTAIGAPVLPEAAAKRMRSHITRTNFAKRREKKGILRPLDKKPVNKRTIGRTGDTEPPKCDASVAPVVRTKSHPYTLDFYRKQLPVIWSHIFLDGSEYPQTPEEAAWASLIVSDPALAESSIAIGLRHWVPDAMYQEIFSDFSAQATKTVISRLNSGQALSDAVLATVLTLAFGERLVHNPQAWNIHIDGAVQLVRERIARGLPALSPWFRDVLIVDTVNDVFGFPRLYHHDFVKAARATHDPQYEPLIRVAGLSEDLVRLRASIEGSRKAPFTSENLFKRILVPINALLTETRALRTDQNPSLKAVVITIELIVYLTWNQSTDRINLTAVAKELEDAMRQLRGRTCCYMDLTSCQLMIGAIAADEGSTTKAWFMNKLRNASQKLSSRGWNGAMDILERNFGTEDDIVNQFRTIWCQMS